MAKLRYRLTRLEAYPTFVERYWDKASGKRKSTVTRSVSEVIRVVSSLTHRVTARTKHRPVGPFSTMSETLWVQVNDNHC